MNCPAADLRRTGSSSTTTPAAIGGKMAAVPTHTAHAFLKKSRRSPAISVWFSTLKPDASLKHPLQMANAKGRCSSSKMRQQPAWFLGFAKLLQSAARNRILPRLIPVRKTGIFCLFGVKRVLWLGSRASRSLLPLLFACIFLAITRAQAQAPVIDTQPQKQSVASGATATFSVSVSGAEPLAYQWQFNGTNILGSTNQTLVLTNVQPRQYGEVLVVITNSFGSITSAVAELRVDEQLSFRIVSLLTNGIIATEASSQISDDKGGIAVSSLNVFVTGGEGNGDRARTGRFPIDTLTGGTSLATGFDSLICNLKTETVYSLGNGSTPIQFLNFSITHSNVN